MSDKQKKTETQGEGWGVAPKRRREAQTEARVEVLVPKERKQAFPLSMPERRHGRVAGIITRIPGYPSMNAYINEAVEEKLKRDEEWATQLERKIQELRDEKK